MNSPRTPNEALVLECLDKFNSDPDYEGTEAALRTLFGQFPKNDRFEEVLPKVVTLNALYSAGLRYIELHPLRFRLPKGPGSDNIEFDALPMRSLEAP